MPVSEQISDKIFQLNEDLSKFIQEDEQVSKELNEYARSFKNGLSRDGLAFFMYDKILDNGKTVIDVYIENNKKTLSAQDIKTLNGFKNSINSIFEIKKVLSDGFEMHNLVNEKDYTAKSLLKMVNYRGVVQGNFFVCRIVPYENEYCLLVLNSVIKSADKQHAYKIAVSMQVDNPELLYKDNNKKLSDLEEMVRDLHVKYNEFFKKDEIITLNKNIDDLLGAFNDFAEEGTVAENIDDFIHLPEKYAYFNVQDDVDPFDVLSRRADSAIYDVGMFDPELGILVLPFYGTFNHLFEIEDYKSVEGYKNCITDYFRNGKVPPYVLKKVYEKHREKFLTLTGEVLELAEKMTFDELMHKYKQDFFNTKKFSSTTVLYASNVFGCLMDTSVEMHQEQLHASAKVGRNEVCPCGSGKKFKKCCA